MRRVLVTHIESPVGRRLAKALFHDPEVALVVGVGTEPEPILPGAVSRQGRLPAARPREGAPPAELPALGALRARARRLGDPPAVRRRARPASACPAACRRSCPRRAGWSRSASRGPRSSASSTCRSVFVYDPEPGNVNVVSENQLLGFDGEGDADVRAWIDADLVCQGELHGSSLRMTILRAATIVTEAGEFLNSPPLAHGELAVGYDPMLAVVSDRDVARALRARAARRPARASTTSPATRSSRARSSARSERRLGRIALPVAARRRALAGRAGVRPPRRARDLASTATAIVVTRGSRTTCSASSRSTASRCAARAPPPDRHVRCR